MTVDDLRAVAADIRTKANDVRERAEEPDQWYGPEELAEALDAAGQSEMGDIDADAEHIHAWTPVVALAVADWLDAEAHKLGSHIQTQLYTTDAAVAFVKAWRGEP
jgi:hypothetical protein